VPITTLQFIKPRELAQWDLDSDPWASLTNNLTEVSGKCTETSALGCDNAWDADVESYAIGRGRIRDHEVMRNGSSDGGWNDGGRSYRSYDSGWSCCRW
jgi:hypothetical protein